MAVGRTATPRRCCTAMLPRATITTRVPSICRSYGRRRYPDKISNASSAPPPARPIPALPGIFG